MKRARKKPNTREKVGSQRLAPVMKELRLAYRRIKSSPIARLQWLIDFSYEDIDSLSAGQISDREWDIVMFGVEVNPEDLTLRENFIAYMKYDNFSRDRHLLLASFQTALKEKVAILLAEQWWTHTNPETTEQISLPEARISDYTGHMIVDPLAWLMSTAYYLAKAEQPRIHRCANPGCKKLFIEKRKGRARFCSRKCSAFIRVKTWRKEQRNNR